MNGKELQERRRNLGLRQDELADLLGVARNSVSRWELDSVPIPVMLDLALRHLETEHQKKPTKNPPSK